MKPRYLTKSRFKLAHECPTKLFYTGKKDYVDNKLDDDFLRSLAEGGFQVGELAKLYYPGGTNIDELDHAKALAITNELLQRDKAIIYEAAFVFNNFFIRADIIIKSGSKIRLIEVKAKSYDNEEGFTGKNGSIRSTWKPYLLDVAFQKHVIKQAFPEFEVEGNLMLADKGQLTSIDGLNQKFFLSSVEGRTKVNVIGGTSAKDLGTAILATVNVDEYIEMLYQERYDFNGNDLSFIELANRYAEIYATDQITFCGLGSHCGSCEFKASDVQLKEGLLSGYHECWTAQANFKPEDFSTPHVLKIWDFRKKDDYITNRKQYFQNGITRADLDAEKPKKHTEPGLSRVDRQELQVTKSTTNDHSQYLDKEGLQAELAKWKFPLHFIDFETSAVAIPFSKGRRPYEQIAFQFSHHIVQQDDTVIHAGEWISNEAGQFPNFDFVRYLKKELEKDDGTIFRYAAHENSILSAIYWQLKASNEADREALCEWIKTITKSTGSSAEKWEGKRNMVDLLEMVKKYYYHPMTEGSNSIKQILPAVLNESEYLKNKYSKPVYGLELKSKNFSEQQWIQFTSDKKVKNPYELLPNVFEGRTFEELDQFVVDDEIGIADGGAAMMAYAKMQFTEMSDEERKAITKALLRYCELDTLAMVMIYEAWREWCK